MCGNIFIHVNGDYLPYKIVSLKKNKKHYGITLFTCLHVLSSELEML